MKNQEKSNHQPARQKSKLVDDACYRILCEKSAQGILVADFETRQFMYANPRICQMFGYSNEEMLSLGVGDIHPHNSLALVINEFEAQARGEKMLAENLPCLRKDGSVFYADITTSPAQFCGRTCNLGFFTDVSERKRTEALLREGEAKFNMAFHVSPYLMAITRADDGLIVEANEAFIQGLGFCRDEVVGKTTAELGIWKSLEIRDKITSALVTAGRTNDSEVIVRRKDGQERDLLFGAGRIELREKPHLVSVAIDITDRKRIETEWQKLAAVVQHSRELVNLSTLEGKMTFLNDAGGKILGIDPKQCESVNIMQVIPEQLQDMVQRELIPTLMRGETWEGDLQYRNLKTGCLTDVHAITFTVRHPKSGQPWFLANVLLDITKRQTVSRPTSKNCLTLNRSKSIGFDYLQEGAIENWQC